MSKTFQELYREQQELQKGLANHWGYSLGSTSLDHAKQKKARQSAAPNVANITLRKFGKEINKTAKIKQVQDQIKALHNERKLMEEQQKAAQAAERGEPIELSENKLIQWMENIVEEYNSILAHRHLMKQSHFHQFTKNGLGDEQTPTEKLIAEIEKKRAELKQCDMTRQISINREIATLYKEFYKGKAKPQTSIGYYKTKTVSPEPPRSIHTLKKDRSDNTMLDASQRHYNRTRFLSLKNSSSDLQLLKLIQNKKMASSKEESPKNDLRANTVLKKYKESEYRKHYISSRQATRQQPLSTQLSKQFHSKSIDSKGSHHPTLQKDLLSPYVDSSQLSSFKDMQRKIRSNHEALDIWKGKVSEACSNSRIVRKLNESVRMKKIESYHEDREKEKREEQIEDIIQKNIKIISMEESDPEGRQHQNAQIQIRSKEKEQEDIFSELLRKRNNKFNKLWGTRILVKYDSRGQARQMLRGDSEKHPNSSSKKQNNDAGVTNGYNTSKDKMNEAKTMSEEKANLQIWLQEINDSEHYQRTCKNQKINLLLKHR